MAYGSNDTGGTLQSRLQTAGPPKPKGKGKGKASPAKAAAPKGKPKGR